MDDNPVKPVDSTANSRPALAMAHSKSSYKVKESGIGRFQTVYIFNMY
jgi:katanin p80 WD40 repeat-containing subunit B1